MYLRRSVINSAVHPTFVDFVKAVAQNSARAILDALTITAITDNSTGVAGSTLVAVPTQDAKVTPASTNQAQRAGFNTAIGKVNDAIAVLADYLNDNGWTALGLLELAGANGTVTTPGTVPALDKTVTGVVAGSAAMLRTEMNAAIVRARNNLSALVRVYNTIAVAQGIATLADKTNGKSPQWDIHQDNNIDPFAAGVTATTTVAAETDLATKAAADAALTALANNIAKLATEIDATLLHANTTGGKVPIVMLP